MDSITQKYQNADCRRRWACASLIVLLFCCVINPAWAAKRGRFSIQDAQVLLNNDVYELNAHINYQLSNTQIDALTSGVPLEIRLELEVRRDYWGMLDWADIKLNQTYQLRYHALSQQYLIKNRNTGIQNAYPDLNSALTELGQVSRWPLFDRNTPLLEDEMLYQVRVRAYLDIDALPLALRAVAYVSARWRTSSEWYTWPFPR